MIKLFYGWWIVIACFAISLYVGGVVFFGFTAFFQPMQDELGWSHTQISLGTSLRGLEMGFFAPLAGLIVSRYGARKILIAGIVALGFALLLLSRVQSLSGFYGAFILIAFGAGGCTSVVTMTAVANWFHRKVGIAMGIMASGFGASGLIVPVIVELISALGWRPTLIVLGIGAWLLCIPLSTVIRDKPEAYGLLPDGGGGASGEVGSGPEPEEGPGLGLRKAVRNASFLYLNLAEAIRLLSVTAVVIHVMPYLQDAGIGRGTAGMVAASIPLASIVGRFGFGWLSDHYPKRVVLAASYVMMSGGLVAFCFVKTAWLLILFVLLFSPGFGGSMVLRGAILRDYFGKDSFGKLLGVIMGAGSLGGILGPTMAGWIFDHLGTYRPMWAVLSCLTVLSSAIVLRVRPRE